MQSPNYFLSGNNFREGPHPSMSLKNVGGSCPPTMNDIQVGVGPILVSPSPRAESQGASCPSTFLKTARPHNTDRIRGPSSHCTNTDNLFRLGTHLLCILTCFQLTCWKMTRRELLGFCVPVSDSNKIHDVKNFQITF